MQQNIIYQGNSVISVETHLNYAHPVVTKKPSKCRPSQRSLQSLGKEYEITSTLNDVAGVRKALERQSLEGQPALILEYIGKTLQKHIRQKTFNLRENLGLIAYVLVFLLAFFAAQSFLSAGFAHAQQAPSKKNVLVLHGLWRIRTWEISFNSSLHNELLADKAVTAGITHIYLGLEDFPDGVYPQKLIEELRDRLEKNPVDLVISVVPGADGFLLSYGQELFPGVPKVFALPGTRNIQTLKELKNAVIIPSAAEKTLQNTVDRIFSLLPDTRHLVVVCGNSSLDHNYLKVAKKAIASSKRVTNVSYLVGVPLDELGKNVSNLATDTAILFTTYAEDKNGKKETALDFSLRLAVSANAPVFSFHEILLDTGIIGGHITSSESYGKTTAEAALILLKGEQPAAISPNEKITFDAYDWRALKRWNISEDRLPSGSQVRHKTLTLWETYKVQGIVGIGIICLETILIYALFISLMRSKRMKETIQESEERHRTLQENVPVGIFRTSNSGKLISVNPAASNMFGLDAGMDLASYQVTDFYNDPEKRRDILNQLKTEGKITDFEIEYKRKDGSLFWGALNSVQVTDKDGNFIFIDGVVQDITQRKELQEGLLKSKEFNQSILTSLVEHIAVLDYEGNVLTVNDAWIEFARQKEAGPLKCADSGMNYLRVCREASDKGDAIAAAVHDGILKVLNGSSSSFGSEFSCDSPTVKHWFMMTVSPFKGQKGGVIVAHTDITSLKTAELNLRNAYAEISELQNQLSAESAYLQDEIKLDHNFENIIGQSEGLKYVLNRVQQVAPQDTHVLISGETGTGKELMARALHKLSHRGKRTMVKVNCAALPRELIESELFGHEKGAFTGATTTQLGRFELAKGSTLFLDEIGELPLELQAKLLRVLESGEFERLGRSLTLHSDARIIAATNRVLEEEVLNGRFREDLWYRLKVFPITVPPLRDRKEDISLLVGWFVDLLARKIGKQATEISKSTMQMLQNYPWPGNIRELRHAIEGAMIATKGKKLHFELPKNSDAALSDFKTLEEMECNYILQVLKAKNWRIDGKDKAASTLGMHVSTLRSRMKKLGIKKPMP